MNYLPSIYVLFAIWGIPLKLLGIAPLYPEITPQIIKYILYYKTFTTFFYLASTFMVYKIGLVLDFNKKKGNIMCCAFFYFPNIFF
jgi:hypothetical protein